MLLYSGLTTEANPENLPVIGTQHKSTDTFTSPSSSCGTGKGLGVMDLITIYFHLEPQSV